MPTGIYPRTKKHRDRISNGLRGHTVSAKTRKKISLAHLGMIFTEEHRKKLRLAKLGRKLTKESIAKRTFSRKGYHHSKETREKISKANKGQAPWCKGKKMNLEFGEKISKSLTGKKFSISHRLKLREHRMHQVFPRQETSIEKLVQNELSSREIAFYPHYSIFGQPDIALPDKKIAIFCDGDYWHNLEKSKKRDKEVNLELRNQGWLLLRYWEHEINTNLDAVVDEIEDILYG